MAVDMPSETKGFESGWDRVIAAEEARTEEYAVQIVAPVRIMVSYDNHREYYLVTPEFENLKDSSK